MPPSQTSAPTSAASKAGLARELPLDAVLVVLFWIASMLVGYLSILVMNDGMFTYTMDDPYIHLAVAEEISRGNYGVNIKEVCAPCSSPLWPVLLAPLVSLDGAHVVPFSFNVVFGLATAWLALVRVRRVFGSALSGASGELFKAGLVIFFLLATNCLGLAFTGMEHNLQMLLAVLVVEGLLRIAEERAPGAWFYLAMVVGPWVRYENLALTAAGMLVLFFSGRKRLSFACGAGALAGLAGFSGFLVHLGLSPVPSSIKAKSTLVDGQFAESVVQGLASSLNSDRGILLALGVAVLLAFILLSRQGRRWKLFAAGMAIAGTLHMLFGAYGWVNRYEVYMSASLLWAMFGIFGFWLARYRRFLRPRHGLALLPLLVAIAFPYLQGLATLPLAGNNIYEQQYQMHRFLTEYWKQPVAVNDLGYVSYRNDLYVLDLYGLASARALQARMDGENPEWMSGLAKENGVKLAMIYESWFPGLPKNWEKVGILRLSRPRITPAAAEVCIYAIGPENSAEIQDRLHQFRKTLPRGVLLQTRDDVVKQ